MDGATGKATLLEVLQDQLQTIKWGSLLSTVLEPILETLSSVNRIVYLYHDNSSALAAWNGDYTFIFFDGFAIFNSAKWTAYSGTTSITTGVIRITRTTDYGGLRSASLSSHLLLIT